MAKIKVIHGPNLNLLGTREPGIYGHFTLQGIEEQLQNIFGKEHELDFFQSNCEGALIDAIHEAVHADGLILNLAAYTHTSYALRDAVTSIVKPAVEVHLSNVFAREDFRHVSVIAPICIGTISGFGGLGYELAVRALLDHLS
ncbi:MAG: type II 3-dehydroquinate dehydratase [Deltaproteobacteria bacterium]|nr:type II 3-dehydroquinate dehydratase [Deltaproteobacteria bacterium]